MGAGCVDIVWNRHMSATSSFGPSEPTEIFHSLLESGADVVFTAYIDNRDGRLHSFTLGSHIKMWYRRAKALCEASLFPASA